MKKIKRIWPLLSVFLAVLIIYYPVFGVYFGQDDFFHFKASLTDGSLKEFVKLFGFYRFEERGYGFYRPIFREGLYNLYYLLFGLNSVPFRCLLFGIHFVNIWLVYNLMERMFENKKLSLFAAFFFGAGAVNVAGLYFMAAGVQIMGMTMFLLVAVNSFWIYLAKGGRKWKHLSLTMFLLALATHEMAVAIPLILSGMVMVEGKAGLKKMAYRLVKEVGLFFIILLPYLYLDLKYIGFSRGEVQYQHVFSIKTMINTMAWYGAWAWGLPEMLNDFVRPGLTLNSSLMRYWGNYFRVIFPAFFVSVGLSVIMAVVIWRKERKRLVDKKVWFLIAWFPVVILPVVFLPAHKLSYYLYPAMPAFWGVAGYVVIGGGELIRRRMVSRLIVGGVVGSLLVLTMVSARLGDRTYWMANRGRIAKRVMDQITEKYPKLPAEAVVYVKNDPDYPDISKEWGGTSRQAFYALSGSDAVQLWYQDLTVRVCYEDLGACPWGSELFEVTAKITD